MKPLDHQNDCLGAVNSDRRQGRKESVVVMATALGKTVTAAFDFKEFINEVPEVNRMLYLCHQNEILRKAKDTFKCILGEPENHFGFMNGISKNLNAKYLFASFQTMRDNLDKFDPDDFDYIVVDESHHSVADTYEPVVEYFKPKFKLAMTATPDRLDGRDMRRLFGGRETFSLPLEDALVLGLVTKVDYRLITDEIVDMGKIINPVRMSVKELNRRIFVPKRDSEIVRLIAEKSKSVVNPKTIIFCPSIKYAEKLSKLIPGSMPIHSKQPHKMQDKILQNFRDGKIKSLLTIDKFNEGVDIPEINVVVFLRSTTSPGIFYHQLGRGLRKILGKDCVLVLDFVANCERIEMIQNLVEKIELVKKKYIGRDALKIEKETEVLDFGGFEFTEKARDIVDVLKKMRLGYTRESLIHQMQTLAKLVGRTPTNEDIYKASKDGITASDNSFRRMFKTLNKARRAAGLKINREEKYTKKMLAEQLKWLYKELNRPPVTSDLAKYSKEGLIANQASFLRAFKTMDKARKFAGIEAYKRVYSTGAIAGVPESSKGFLLEKYALLSEKLKRTPNQWDIKGAYTAGEMPSWKSYKKVFKDIPGIQKEVELAKSNGSVAPSESPVIESEDSEIIPLKISDTEVGLDEVKKKMLLSLQDLWNELNRKPTITDVNTAAKEGKIVIPNYEAYKVIFGGLDVALSLLGKK